MLETIIWVHNLKKNAITWFLKMYLHQHASVVQWQRICFVATKGQVRIPLVAKFFAQSKNRKILQLYDPIAQKIYTQSIKRLLYSFFPHFFLTFKLGLEKIWGCQTLRVPCQSVHSVLVLSVRALSPCAQSYKNRAVHSVLLPKNGTITFVTD